MGVGDRVRVQPGGHQPSDMGHVHHQISPHLIGNRPEPGKVEDAGVGAGPDHDHLRSVLQRQLFHLVVVDGLGLGVHPIGHHVEKLAGEVHPRTVGQVPPGGEVHAHDRVPGREKREVNRHVGLGTGMRLHVGPGGAEELLRTLDGEAFHLVDELATAVVAATGVAFGIFIG